MSIFEAVKEQVTTREAAEYYGIQVKRNGMARCIFHDDRNPSMKLDRRYHCFGCQADGDVIDFVSKMFGLTPYEAASKLAVDFGICVPDQNACAASCKTEGSNTEMSTADHLSEYDQEEKQKKEQDNQVQNCELRNRKEGEKKEQKKKKPEETEEQKKEQRIRRLERQIQSWIERAEITLIQYLIYLEEWDKEYRPAGPENDPHPLFCEAMSRKSIVRYQLDTLLYGTDGDRLDFSRRKERG